MVNCIFLYNLLSGKAIAVLRYYIDNCLFDYFGRTGRSSSEKAPPYRTSDPESDRRTGMSRKVSSSGGPASDQSSDTHPADVTYASQ